MNGWLCDVTSDVASYPELKSTVDTVCGQVGRDPEAVERTISISVDPTGTRDFPRHWHLLNDLTKAHPLTGSTEEIARGIRAFGDAGVSHLQIYPIPPTLKTMEQIAPAVELARTMS
ncbi:MAG: hypothetical protein R2853_16455 [Thermomicrobiales bacterium]